MSREASGAPPASSDRGIGERLGRAAKILRPATAGSPQAGHPWSLAGLAGRLVEISGHGASAALTAAFGLILDAQRRGEPAALVTPREATFFPPDAAESGVDLGALVVVRVPAAADAARAADRLLRSGAFGLVVVDLAAAPAHASIPVPLQARLLGLAGRHAAAVVVLTRKRADDPSLGSLVSLRADASRRRVGENRFEVRVRALKDKRGAPGWTCTEVCHGPAGLR